MLFARLKVGRVIPNAPVELRPNLRLRSQWRQRRVRPFDFAQAPSLSSGDNPPYRLARRFTLIAALLALPFAAAGLEVKLTDQKGQPVPDAVVSLVPLDAPAKITPPAEPLVVMQSGQEYVPYVTPVMVGSRVSFPNRDTVQHHCYSLSPAKRFELPLYAGEAKEAIVFDKPGVVALGCNIHDWMSAYIVVLETPWFALSNAQGSAALAEVPAGRYRLEIWQPRLAKPDTRELVFPLAASSPLAITLSLKPDRRIRRAVDTNAGGYK